MGYDVRYGARPLKRAIERELLVPLADAINAYPEQIRLAANVTTNGDRLDVIVRARTDATTGRQVSALASGSTWAEAAYRAANLRRAVQQLNRSPAVLEMNNEVFRLERLRRARAAHPKRKHAPPDPRQAARLKRLNAVADALRELTEEAFALEDSALAAVYDDSGTATVRSPSDVTERAAAGWDDHARLLRSLYALRFDQPDYVTLAVYGEHARSLFRLARLYNAVAQRAGAESVEVYWYERHETQPDKLLRYHAPRPEEFLADVRAAVFGIALAVAGPDALPRFTREAGLHKLTETNMPSSYCLVHVSDRRVEAYVPPPGVEQRGHVGEGLRAPRRAYDLSAAVMDDAVMGQKVKWAEQGIEATLVQAIEHAYNRAVREAVFGND